MTGIEKKKNFVISTIYIVIVLALFYLFFKYILGAVLPIILAMFIAMLLQRPVNFICKKTPLKRGLVSTLMVLFTAIVIIGLLVLFVMWLLSEIKGFIQYLIIRFEDIPTLILTLEGYLFLFELTFHQLFWSLHRLTFEFRLRIFFHRLRI